MAKASRVAARTANTLEELSEQVAALAGKVDEIHAVVFGGGPIETTSEKTGAPSATVGSPLGKPEDPSFVKDKKAAAEKAAKSEKE
jgi:hypothetical protein